MSGSPTLQLEKMQKAFRKLLYTNFSDKIPPHVFEGLAANLCFEREPAVLTCKDSRYYNNYLQTGKPIEAEEFSVRRYLSGFARELGDHFSYEESRNEAINKYYEAYDHFIGSNPELFSYLRFFGLLTEVAATGRIPADTKFREVPAILKEGLAIIENKEEQARKVANIIQSELDDPSILEKHTIEHAAYNRFVALKHTEKLPHWVTPELQKRIQTTSFDGMKAEFIPLFERNVRIEPKDFKAEQIRQEEDAKSFEDTANVHLALVNLIKETLKSLDIDAQQRGNFGRNR